MARIFVGVGSNVGRERNIAAGLAALADAFGPLTLSTIYESAAVGFDGDNFFNLVAAFDSDAPAEAVAETLRGIEQRFGRRRGGPRYAPRTLDLDLLLYGDLVRSDDDVNVPRADVTRFAFVLCPLAEIAGELRHPVTGACYADLWAAFDRPSQPLWPAKPHSRTEEMKT